MEDNDNDLMAALFTIHSLNMFQKPVSERRHYWHRFPFRITFIHLEKNMVLSLQMTYAKINWNYLWQLTFNKHILVHLY